MLSCETNTRWRRISASTTTQAVTAPTKTTSPARSTMPVSAGGAALALGMACWIGANSTSAQWFGRVVSHGPSDRREVALTFDDGPNIVYTLEVRDVLDRYGVKGTFFTVGKALDKRPDISRALLQDGHLLGNHSYLHDELRWLDPRYPELAR